MSINTIRASKMARKTDIATFRDTLASMEGARSSNGALRAALGWTEEKYWRVHSSLFETGEIEKGRGYGGGVILLGSQPIPTIDIEVAASVEAAVQDIVAIRELELYPPALDQLKVAWPKIRQLENCHFEVTALQGRRDTGGSWSRPDLVAISHKKFEYLPERVFELESFELKPEDDVSVIGVMEALAHRESATRCYTIYHTNGREISAFPEASRIEDIAARHGVGVYAARKIDDFEQWAEIVPAKRVNPDPEMLDTFIRRTMSEEAKTKIRKWF